jgi:catechol 2,3-dioxygenase-like lactoylglutathione lyase family enzyme
MEQHPMQKQPRRMDLLGVHSLDHFCVAVPDLRTAQGFYDNFGLAAVAQGSELAVCDSGRKHRWGRILEGPRKQLQYVSFGAFPDDLPRFAARLRQHGIERLAAPPGLDDSSIWLRSPQGHLVEIRASTEKVSPNEPSHFFVEPPASTTRCTVPRSEAPRVYPRRLSHVALYTSDVGGSIDFFRDIVGLRLSDRSLDIVAFMHGVHGSDHHMIALVTSPGPGFHHCSWDVGSVQEVGLGAARMAMNGYAAGWGFGRHVLGSNYFHYVRDPWGSYCEYSAGMDYVPCGTDWQATDSPPEDSMFLWGPAPPQDFVTNFEI